MQMTGNTILITGGNSGIGQGLASAFHALGNTVIITGRNQTSLEAVASAHPGMTALTLNIDDAADIQRAAQQLIRDFPQLNAVIHNAGMMAEEDLKKGETDVAEAHIATNLLGPIRLNSALLPHLLEQPSAAVLTVTSGLAYVPLSLNPTYSATKAAIHSYTQAMRYQLADTNVQVIELVPPYVRTSLQGERQANDQNAMPLDEYIAETMDILGREPDVQEVLVQRVHAQRFAEQRGEHAVFFQRMNDMLVAARRG